MFDVHTIMILICFEHAAMFAEFNIELIEGKCVLQLMEMK